MNFDIKFLRQKGFLFLGFFVFEGSLHVTFALPTATQIAQCKQTLRTMGFKGTLRDNPLDLQRQAMAFGQDLLDKERRPKDSLTITEVLLRLDPANHFALGLKSRALRILERPIESLKVAESMLKAQPSNPFSYINIIQALLALHRLDDALKLANDSLAKFPKESATFCFYKAWALFLKGDGVQASQILRVSLQDQRARKRASLTLFFATTAPSDPFVVELKSTFDRRELFDMDRGVQTWNRSLALASQHRAAK